MNNPTPPKVYEVRYVAEPAIRIDGMIGEPAWQAAEVLDDLPFPWNDLPAPRTEFRALCDDEFLYFAFDVDDSDIVFARDFKSKMSVVEGDRVEVFFAPNASLDRYYCLEIDPLGRVLDYASAFYRKMDRDWSCGGLHSAATQRADGYTVEAALPLATLRALGLPPLDSDDGIVAGVYRGEFSRGADGKIVEQWMSWVDPGTPEPDFHVHESFGRFRMRR